MNLTHRKQRAKQYTVELWPADALTHDLTVNKSMFAI